MAHVYKEFVLTAPSVWQALGAFVKANAGAFLHQGSPLRIIVTSSEAKRNKEQNARYWKAVLEQIATQAWVDGHQFDKDVWHEHYARKYGVHEEMRLPDGTLILRRKSTSDMNVREFAEYMTRVEADAASELGVRFFEREDVA
ncbi:recombination protein NinB [Chitiniphilus eburneus]|uniref:recombination protein NinB n=1 Tax=Chitiniphilus eburneus TaxID=2571148 RepID=UPI0035D020D8